MGGFWQDLKIGARSVKRMSGSAAVSVLVLALGIGLCSSMFSVTTGFTRGYGLPGEDRLAVVWGTDIERDQTQRPISVHDFMDLRRRAVSFEDVAGFTESTVHLSAGDAPRRYSGGVLTVNTLDVLGVQPIMGRGFTEDDAAPGAPLPLLLGHVVWRDDFGMDPAVVGRGVRVNGKAATVIGIMPEGFAFPANQEVWVPLRDEAFRAERGAGTLLFVWARLREGVSHAQAGREVAAIARQLQDQHPDLNAGLGARVETTTQANTNLMVNLILGSMMIAVLCVLFVACANVANLLLARAATRSREAGIRLAMGASRFRVAFPFFVESTLLAGAGALLGLGLAYFGIEWFDAATAPSRTGRPYFMTFELDAPLVAFVIGLAVLTGLVAGVAPAVQVSRSDVDAVLKDGGRGVSSLYLGRLSRALVITQVSLSCALLVGAGLMTRSIMNVGDVNHPYRTDELLTARVGLYEPDYPDRDARHRFWEDLRAELANLPDVAAAGLTTGLPHAGWGRQPVRIEGTEYADPASLPVAVAISVSEGYFAALGVEVRGRDFTARDTRGSQPVAVVNQPFVERHFHGADPVGRRFRVGVPDTAPPITVVGVVADLHAAGNFRPGSTSSEAAYYTPLEQGDVSFVNVAIAARTGAPLALTGDVRRAVQRLDPDLPIYDVRTQAEVIDQSVWYYPVFGTAFIAFGLAALFMASVGLYGVLIFSVSRRTREIGIRMALGADGPEVIGLVVRQATGHVAIGLAIGLALAIGLTRLIGFLMFGVDPQDPLVLGATLVSIAGVGAIAAYVPARRATRVDPLEVIHPDG